MMIGARKLLSTGLVFARAWRGQAFVIAFSERLKLMRQMAAAAGKMELVLLSFFMEVNSVEVEEELLRCGYASLGRRNVDGKMGKRAEGDLEKADFRGSDVDAGQRTYKCRYARDP